MAKIKIRKSSVSPTILISGGGSYLGANLSSNLISEGAQVICVDTESVIKKERLASLKKKDNFTFINHDINKSIPKDIESVDFIFHLSGFQDSSEGTDPSNINSLLANSNGTKNLLKLAAHSSSKFLLGSLIDIYQGLISSISLDHYFGVSHNQEKKFSDIEVKRFSEALVWEYHKKHDVDARITRFSNIYGPAMSLDTPNSLSSMITGLLNHKPVTILGDGLQKEYYLYIEDAAEGLIKAMFSRNTNGKIFPLSPIDPITPLELARLFKAVAKTEISVNFVEKGEFNVTGERNIERGAQRQIDFTPRVDLKEGLKRTLYYFGYQEPEDSYHPTKGVTSLIDNDKSDVPSLIKKAFPHLTEKIKIPSFEKDAAEIPPTPEEPSEREEPTKGWSASGRKKSPVNLFKTLKAKDIYLSIIATLVVFVTLTTVLPTLLFVFFSFSGFRNLQKSVTSAKSLNLSQVRDYSESANNNFENAKRNIDRTYLIRSFIKELAEIHRLLNVGAYVSTSLESLSQNTLLVENIYKNLDPNSTDLLLSKEELDNFSSNVSLAKKYADLASAEIENIETNKIPKFIPLDIDEVRGMLGEFKVRMEELQTISEESSTILGYKEARDYLVLLQNPSELRAGGGFIGSYGLITLENGKIKDLKIDDVYNVDGQLDKKGINYPPPAPLAEILKIENLRIRDANWYTDFSQNASIINTLFKAATGTSPDGIIAVNLFVIEDLLELIGEVSLPSYNETINAKNLYEKAQFISESEFFPGSTQKKTFLTTLGDKVIKELFSLNPEALPQLMNTLYETMLERDLIINLKSGKVREVLYENNWDGRLAHGGGDFLYVVDSNLGTNKANFEVSKTVNVDIRNTNRDGSFEITLNLNYIHKGKERSWPGGPYTNYLRVLVPTDSFLHRVIRSGENIDEKGEDITNSVIVGEEGGKRTFETSFTLNPQQSLSLSFNYSIPKEVASVSDNYYATFIQKQPGTRGESYVLNFTTPFGMKLETIPVGSEESLEGLKVPLTLDTNKNILIEF